MELPPQKLFDPAQASQKSSLLFWPGREGERQHVHADQEARQLDAPVMTPCRLNDERAQRLNTLCSCLLRAGKPQA